MKHEYALVTNPGGDMDEQEQNKQFRPKHGAGTVALALMGFGVALGVRAALDAGTARQWWGSTTAAGVQTALGAGAAFVGAAYGSPRAGAALGAANIAVGGDALVKEVALAYQQAPSSTQPGTTQPGTTQPSSAQPGATTQAPARGLGGRAPGGAPARPVTQGYHAQYRG